jgi:hypothetical protein
MGTGAESTPHMRGADRVVSEQAITRPSKWARAEAEAETIRVVENYE